MECMDKSMRKGVRSKLAQAICKTVKYDENGV